MKMGYRNIKDDEFLRDYDKNEKRYGFLSALSKDELIDRYFYQIKVSHDIIEDLKVIILYVGGAFFIGGLFVASCVFLIFS